MQMFCKILIWMVAIGFSNCVMAAEINLMQQGAIITGSSFKGIADYVKVKNDYYFDKLNDGKKSTFWTPMDEQAPHWLEMRWRCALKVSQFAWESENIVKGSLAIWLNGEWRKIGDVRGDNGQINFPEVKTDRMRLEIAETKGIPRIFELKAYGPPQPVPPETIPTVNAPEDRIIIKKATLSQHECKPGDKLKIQLELSSDKKLHNDYYFIVEIREKQLPRFRTWAGDFEVVSAIAENNAATTEWIPGKNYPAELELELPPFAPSGETAITVTALSKDNRFACPAVNTTDGNEIIGRIKITRDDKMLARPDYPQAAISEINGQRGFKIGDEFFMPFFMRYMRYADFERFYESRLNNIELQYFMMYWSCIGVPYRQELFQRLEQQITSMLRVRPNSYFLIGLDVRPSKYWLKENPDEWMRNAKGERIIDPNCSYISYGAVSFGSEKYEKSCLEFIDALFDFLKNKPYAGRIIGWQPWTNTTNDAFIGGTSKNQWVKNRKEIYVGDFHPGALKLYREWLRKKYHDSISELRKAWNSPDADFANATPSAETLVAENSVPGGVFRDPAKDQAAFDYIEFFPSLLGGFYQRLATYLKAKTNNKALVFIHYGALLDSIPGDQPGGKRIHINNNDFPELLRDKNIDMFVQAQPYSLRHAGQPFIVYQPVESINLHGKMYLSDYDPRTFVSGSLIYGRHRSEKETKALFYRDLSFLLLRNSGAWLADMSECSWDKWTEARNNWMADKKITKITADIFNAFRQATPTPRKPATEIAVFISTSTPKYEDIFNASAIYHSLFGFMIFRQLPWIGAPYDLYMMSDLDNPGIRKDYKLYIFLNPFFMTDAEKQAVEALKSGGRTLLWFYAPGYVDPTKGLDVNNITRITGIKTAQKGTERSELQMSTVKSGNPILAGIAGKSYSVTPYAGKTGEYHPAKIWPVFYVTDPEAKILAKDKDGKTAWAVKQFKNWNSVYSAVPYLECDALRGIAAFAGVHLYSDKPVIMSADSQLLIFHNGYEGTKELTVSLPTACTVTDALSGKTIVENRKSFKLQLGSPETQILRYDKCKAEK